MALQKLQVIGTKLCDRSGKPVQLRGISTLGFRYPEYITREAFESLKNEWGINLIRLAMYTDEPGGYCTDGDREELKRIMIKGVEIATELSMYVIIDWHILLEKSPLVYKDEAIAFFDEMAALFADYTNVLYEICNEPQESPFASVIRPFALEVIPTIRKHDKDAVIIVGTDNWSQDVDDVIGNAVDDKNVMYALHFYAASHQDKLMKKAVTALEGGVPIFISECSICDASGDGILDRDWGGRWIDWADSNDISYVVWNLSNKDESSAILRPDSTSLANWHQDEYSETGLWFKQRIFSALSRENH
ncbi:MAG: glycoside hydrolase family 5 protein [Lachnospiraceae bacterium]|nr:glycoside hydrolase family 5 protein [Lachnospiraceae bacterium]